MPAFRVISSRAEALARDALVHLASTVPRSDGSRLLRLRGLLAPVIEALEVREEWWNAFDPPFSSLFSPHDP